MKVCKCCIIHTYAYLFMYLVLLVPSTWLTCTLLGMISIRDTCVCGTWYMCTCTRCTHMYMYNHVSRIILLHIHSDTNVPNENLITCTCMYVLQVYLYTRYHTYCSTFPGRYTTFTNHQGSSTQQHSNTVGNPTLCWNCIGFSIVWSWENGYL